MARNCQLAGGGLRSAPLGRAETSVR
jgi:hypothetical protein